MNRALWPRSNLLTTSLFCHVCNKKPKPRKILRMSYMTPWFVYKHTGGKILAGSMPKWQRYSPWAVVKMALDPTF